MNHNHLKQNNNLQNKKNFFTTILNQLFHGEPKNRNNLLKLIHNYEHNSLIDKDTSKMLEGVMNIIEKKVRDIMIPKSQVITLNKFQTLKDQIDIIIKHAHSRFPIVGMNKDHVIGILIVKDMIPLIIKDYKNFNIEKIIRPTIVVPENKRLDKMLKEFRDQHNHMAIVIDEFGNMSGLITIEDILELIVGNIEDEYDDIEENYDIQQINHNTFMIHALIPIKEFNKTFNAHFNHEEFDTIGGLIMQSFGHLPKINESINIKDYTFRISATNSRRILQVLVQCPKQLSVNKDI